MMLSTLCPDFQTSSKTDLAIFPEIVLSDILSIRVAKLFELSLLVRLVSEHVLSWA